MSGNKGKSSKCANYKASSHLGMDLELSLVLKSQLQQEKKTKFKKRKQRNLEAEKNLGINDMDYKPCSLKIKVNFKK